MDLATLDLAADAERGTAVNLLSPLDGKPLVGADGEPVQITVRGAEGLTYRRAWRDAQSEIAKVAGQTEPTVEDLDGHTVRLLAAVTAGWRNIVVDGHPWEFNRDAAVNLYRRFKWVRDQVEAAVLDRRRFVAQAEAA